MIVQPTGYTFVKYINEHREKNECTECNFIINSLDYVIIMTLDTNNIRYYNVSSVQLISMFVHLSQKVKLCIHDVNNLSHVFLSI